MFSPNARKNKLPATLLQKSYNVAKPENIVNKSISIAVMHLLSSEHFIALQFVNFIAFVYNSLSKKYFFRY